MLGEEASIFPKQIKIDDYGEFSPDNVIRLVETSNLLIGSGARTSTAAIVLAKTLHFMHEEKELRLQGINILELGCGAGLLGIYLGCLGANVLMADVPSMKDLAERNININKNLLKGKVEFVTANWKRNGCLGKCQTTSGQSSTSSQYKEECLTHLMPKIGLTIVCEGGGIQDLEHQLRWLGKEGMILCFLERQYNSPDDYLSERTLEMYLLQKGVIYDKIDEYHPDYCDQRVQIYRIYSK